MRSLDAATPTGRTGAAVAVLVVGLTLAATAAAHSPNPNGNCSNVEDEADAAALFALYVDLDDPSVWQETNDHPGLQTHAHTCTRDGQQVTIDADARLL